MHFLSVVSLVSLLLPSGNFLVSTPSTSEKIDAVSVRLPAEDATAEVRGRVNGQWTAWETVSVDNEQDPLLRESTLVMFDAAAEKIEVRGEVEEVHPVRISNAPVSYTVAATRDPGPPRILSREEWGADDSFLYRTASTTSSTPAPEENGTSTTPVPNQRVSDCEQAQTDYPNEFKTKKRVTTGENGQKLRWVNEYSPSVKLIAVHHTAIKVTGDSRSGAERVRALYAYHANNRGWGDVGYHYLIDEDGKIYEGKSGGEYVVGGHAYCNNIGTVGVALLGNFEEEKPTQNQLKALQWLIVDLSETYDIDLSRDVKSRGKTMSPVVGHRDLVSTECPGYYIYGSLSQILKNAASGNVDASVTLPRSLSTTIKPRSSSSRATTRQTVSSTAGGLPRRVQRILSTRASQELRRKLGSNPGREVEDGTAARLANRLNGSSISSRSSKSSKSSSSSKSSRSSLSSKSSSSSRSSISSLSSTNIRVRLSRVETGASSCDAYNLRSFDSLYRGKVTCTVIDNIAALINTLTLEEYMMGLAEEPDTEPYEKQRAFAIAARTYAAYYSDPKHRKFPNMPYDGDDSPARFQLYGGIAFEKKNPLWVKAVKSTANIVMTKNGEVIRAPYFSADDGRTRTPEEAGWKNFPFAEIFTSKPDPWCIGDTLRGHGVGMSGCGSEGQAHEGKTGEEILEYYYPGTKLSEVVGR